MKTRSNSHTWSPSSWRNFRVVQQPEYEDAKEVADCLNVLSRKPPVTTRGEVDHLLAELSEAVSGKRFVLHGGDCAERFADCRAEILKGKLQVLLQMSMVLTYATRKSVTRIGRLAGQYAKPRSQGTEVVNGMPLPVYRGDLINSAEASPEARKADPGKMLEGYHHAAASLNYIRALIEGGFADLHHPEYWVLGFIKHGKNSAAYHRIVDAITDAIRFMDTIGAVDASERLRRISFYTSHEALLLPYEEALTRYDDTPACCNLGAHFLWLGYRTSDIKGAHVEYLRGITNPIGIKVGPGHTPEQLVELIRRLDPKRTPGRITLITRFGAQNIAALLPPFIQRVQKAKHPVLWSCDPMHGNTETLSDGRKTRRLTAIFSELEQCFKVHEQLGSCLGGVHFEQTGETVTECISGPLKKAGKMPQYETACDPRLNGAQALEMAFLIARLLR
jgi:3-deoxy-7-phosphoheptulonate synthase